MIIISGPGRTGTSFIAGLYKDLGLDPGGTWSTDNNAGLEHPDVVRLNKEIIQKSGVSTHGTSRRLVLPKVDAVLGPHLGEAVKRMIPQSTRRQLRARLSASAVFAGRDLRMLPLERVADYADQYGDRMRSLAGGLTVAKDPLFIWTIPFWVFAGAQVDAVVLASRRLDQSIASHAAAGHLRFRSQFDAANAAMYGVGVMITTCLDNDIPMTQVRYPDVLTEPLHLHDSLPLLRERTYEEFLTAFSRTVRPDRVTSYESPLAWSLPRPASKIS